MRLLLTLALLPCPLADYFNLLSIGQFVPQLTLGDGLCNGTGAPLFDCAPCDPNPETSKQWYMQAQYYWSGHDPNDSAAGSPQLLNRRSRRAAESDDNKCHVIAGDLIPVDPGDVVTTSFVSRRDIAGIWVALFSRCQRYRC